MRALARRPQPELGELFVLTAQKMRLYPAIVEKDFWVCWLLDYLFARSPWKRSLAFKGGTSLSKAFGLIKRFSEDIDLILDWRLLGYGKDEPWLQRSNTQQDLFNEKANARSADFLKSVFAPRIKDDLSFEVGREIDVSIDEYDPNTVLFRYPCAFSDASIVREIRIESGALAAWTPASYRTIKPYAADFYPQLFKEPCASVYTVNSERTFWEKLTILHKEAMRTEKQGMVPVRYSRHYYDVWCMCNSPVKKAALADIGLLDAVVAFKKKFYRCAWAKYELATAESISLLPPKYAMSALAADYAHMGNMIFGDKPSMGEILSVITDLEREIHAAV